MQAIMFKHDHVKLIVSCIKIETRRNWDSFPVDAGDVVDAVVPERDCTFCWGTAEDPVRKGYVCGWCAGKPKLPAVVFARLKIVGVRQQCVSEFTDDDAKREGYDRAEQLWDLLVETLGELDLSMSMVVVRFELLEDLSAKNAEQAKRMYQRARA